MNGIVEAVRSQYERFPYPPIPWVALPRRGQGAEALRMPGGAAGARVLVAGAGTFEAIVAARANPLAREIVAVDLSAVSLRRLRARALLARARITAVEADLHRWEPGGAPFDFILATNVLHHAPDPAALLARLAGWLRPGGHLRIVTYPRASRIFMRLASGWLRLNGIDPATPGLRRRARAAIAALPEGHPARSCFEGHPEIRTRAGLVDAFLHAWERPLAPLEWRDASAAAGLRLVREAQDPSSRGSFLDELLPEEGAAARIGPWEKLQVVDDLLEACANPVLWLVKEGEAPPRPAAEAPSERRPILIRPGEGVEFSLASRLHWELGVQLRSAKRILAASDVALEGVLEKLSRTVGPRVSLESGAPLPGLSIGEYAPDRLLHAPPPEEIDPEALKGRRLTWRGRDVPGADARAQLEWIQIREGAVSARIEGLAFRRS